MKLCALRLGLAVTLVAWAWHPGAQALERIDHPELAGFPDNVAGTLREAREALAASQREGGASGEDFGRMGMVYQAHEQYIPAAQAYRNAAEMAPADARWPYFLGTLAAGEGDFDQAVAMFRASRERNPGYTPSRIRLARALMEAGRLAEAREALEALAADRPGIAAVEADLGTLAAQEGRPEQAIVHFERALELQPQATRLYYPLALAHRALGDVDKARALLAEQGEQEVIFDDPLYTRMRGLSGSFAYYMSLGLAAARNEQFQTALSYMQRAVEANPESAAASINLARMREATGDVEAGIAELDRLLAEQPGDALALFNRGAMHEVLGDEAAAREDYRAALRHAPQQFESRLQLASNLMRAGSFDEAAEHFRAGFELRPGRVELLLFRGAALEAAGRCTEAVGVLLDLVRRLPEDFEALIAYSRVVSSCPEAGPEHRENALNAARNMYRLSPELAVVTTLAMAEAASGDFDAAVELQTQAAFQAVRDGREQDLPLIRAQLQAYEAGRAADAPWSDDHPLLNPRRLTLEDRQ